MQLKESIRINAPRERVFAALNDIEILRQAIPGCEELAATSPTEFTATVSARVGPLKARFKGQVSLSDIVAPESYTLSGEGRGGPAGHAKIRSQVKLEADGQATILHYDVKADIGGKLAQLGGHLVEKTSQKLAAEFFQKFEELVAPTEAVPTIDQPATSSAKATASPASWIWLTLAAATVAALAWVAL